MDKYDKMFPLVICLSFPRCRVFRWDLKIEKVRKSHGLVKTKVAVVGARRPITGQQPVSRGCPLIIEARRNLQD